MGRRIRLSHIFRSTSRSMRGRISERVMLVGFLGRRAISLVCQLEGMCFASHIMWRDW